MEWEEVAGIINYREMNGKFNMDDEYEDDVSTGFKLAVFGYFLGVILSYGWFYNYACKDARGQDLRVACSVFLGFAWPVSVSFATSAYIFSGEAIRIEIK